MTRRRALPGALARARLEPLVASVAMLSVACSASDDPEPVDAASAFVAPRDADILLADLTEDTEGLPSIGTPTNVTQRPGYDNQPRFTPDGSGLWYTAIDPQSGQADIWRYDLGGGTVTRVTMSSPESEYSATPLPDGTGISTIRVEADSTQRLWRFDFDGGNPAVILPGVAPVGYHAWVDGNTVVMFILGDPPTLQRGDLRSGQAEVVARDIGRSIQSIPGSHDISFVQRHEDGTSTIMRLPADGGDPEPIAETLDGGDDHAWTPDGVLVMADGAVVFAWRGAAGWVPIGDFTELHVALSRLAVSPDGTQIALVAEVAPIDLPSE